MMADWSNLCTTPKASLTCIEELMNAKINLNKDVIFTTTNNAVWINMKTILNMDLVETHKVYVFEKGYVFGADY